MMQEAPSGEKLPVRVSGPSPIGNLIEFKPREAGIHHIDVKLGKHHITGSPYQIQVIDPSQVKVYNLKNHFVGNPCTFNVDASAAGEGILEIVILADGKTVPHRVVSLDDGQYEVRFTGREATRHRIHLTFNEEYVPGPSGVKMSSKIRESEKGKYAIEWVPVEVGSHLVEVYFFGKLVKGFPYVVKVFDPHRVKMLTKFETIGKFGEPMDLFIDVSQAGEGQLEIIVECEGDTIPNTIKQEENGMFIVTFVPQRGGAHKVYLKFNEENVTSQQNELKKIVQTIVNLSQFRYIHNMYMYFESSPFIFEVKDDRVKVDQAMLTSTEVHRVKSANVQPPTLKMNTGYLRVHENQWFFLESSGVLLDPENLTIFVIAIHLDNFRQGGVGEAAGFDVDFDVTNMLDYTVKIMAPSGRYVDHTANRGNDYGQSRKEIAYIPDESGPHEIYITYAGFELPALSVVVIIDGHVLLDYVLIPHDILQDFC
ncbi:hypothetical protein KUTeg_011727 [Tegillarca granosa]|uniref:Filamin n=1 Tax=Tegillarca granosa TaxID=220873 RepID=A0ABQ9EXH3_TEGGR|nr:hypothetical protein KUTeg_011727 [Tegillarca granosa]